MKEHTNCWMPTLCQTELAGLHVSKDGSQVFVSSWKLGKASAFKILGSLSDPENKDENQALHQVYPLYDRETTFIKALIVFQMLYRTLWMQQN